VRWFLIDRIIECEPGQSAIGKKKFSPTDEFFQDHFPGMPIVPGVLQIEMIAQMAGKCIAMSLKDVLPVLGNVKGAKFYHNIRPDDQCLIKIAVTKVAKSYSMAEGHIEVDGKKMSSASILFGHIPRQNLNSEDFDAVTQEWLKSQAKVEERHE
jgi:3-hydroxyacyl-[acyl-carrier-protein] dehydratase